MFAKQVSTGTGHSPPPLDGQPASVEDQLVEGLLGGRLGSLPRCELDEGTLLPLDDGDGADLTKLVEMVPAGETDNAKR